MRPLSGQISSDQKTMWISDKSGVLFSLPFPDYSTLDSLFPNRNHVVRINYQDNIFHVLTFLPNGVVNSIDVNEDLKSIVLDIKNLGGEGQLFATLPRPLIDSIEEGIDTEFIVTVDGEQVEHQEHFTTNSERELVIPISDDSKQVIIMGTQVIPEFPISSIAVIGLATIMSLIISKLKIFNFKAPV